MRGLVRRNNFISLAAVAAATAVAARYAFELDAKSVLFAVGVVLSLAWNIINTIETRTVEERIRRRDITFREFDKIAASPLRSMLRRLMDMNDNLADLFRIENAQEKTAQTEKMNKDISRQFYSLQSECMRIDALDNLDFGTGWAEPVFDAEGEILRSLENTAAAEDENAFSESVGDAQTALSDLNASMQRKIYGRFHEIG